MKWILGLLSITFLLAFAQNEQIKRKKYKTPPGTVRLNDSLFIDKTEVANIHWREFTQAWILYTKHDTALYEKMMQDTLLLDSFYNGTMVPFSYSYHRHPSYNYYPVVGITYEQVVAFCLWRSDRLTNTMKYIQKKILF